MYKMLTGKYDKDSCIEFKFVTYSGSHTRGNTLKIYQDHVHCNLRKYFFANRVIYIYLESLFDSVIEANSVNSFKNRIDKYWNNFDFKYNWKADPTGPEAVVNLVVNFMHNF